MIEHVKIKGNSCFILGRKIGELGGKFFLGVVKGANRITC